MRKILKITGLGAAMLLLASSAFAQADTIAITLKDAWDIALSKSLTVMVADKEIEKTGYEKKGAYASLFPNVAFSGSYQRTIKKQTMVMKMGDKEQKISMGTLNNTSGGFNASMPLVNVALWRSLDISGKSVDLAVEKARESRQDLINQVEQAFYTCLLASDLCDVYKENYSNAEENYRQIKAKYENGRVAKYDMIRAEVNMQNAEPNVYDSQNQLMLAQWQLKALMGVNLNTNIKCIGSLSDYTYQMQKIVMASDSIDLSANSTMRQLEIQDEMLDLTYKMQRAQYYPTLAATAQYNWISMSNDLKVFHYTWNPYSVAALSLQIPIFSGFQKLNTLRQTKIQQQQLDLQKENARRLLVVGVKQSLSSLETALKQYKAAKATVEGAQTGYDIAKKMYEVGRATILEVNDAQLALLQSKLNLNQSIYSYLVAKSALDLVLGAERADKEYFGTGAQMSPTRQLIIKNEE
jgi:outer membrane protein TolC